MATINAKAMRSLDIVYHDAGHAIKSVDTDGTNFILPLTPFMIESLTKQLNALTESIELGKASLARHR